MTYDESHVVTLLREVEPPAAPPDRLREVTRRARAREARRATALATALGLVLVGGIAGAVSLAGKADREVLTVAQAAQTTAETGSARVTVSIDVPMGGFTLSGPVDFRDGRYALKGTFAGGTFEMRGIGKDRWTKAPGFVAEVAGKPWLHSTEDQPVNGPDSIAGAEPTKLLASLTREGKQLSRRQAGDRTVTVMEVPRRVLGSGGDDRVRVRVEVDGEGRVRLLSYTDDDSGFGAAKMSMAYDDFGIDVDVRPPPADQVAELADVTSGLKESGGFGSGKTPELCKMLKEQAEQAVGQAPAEQREAIRKAFETMTSECEGKK